MTLIKCVQSRVNIEDSEKFKYGLNKIIQKWLIK